MRYVLAIFAPWISFFTIKRVGSGFLCLLLQLTIVGWFPAVIWAIASVNAFNADKRTDRLVDAVAKAGSAGRSPPSAQAIAEYVPAEPRKVASAPIPTVESYLRSRPTGAAQRDAFADVFHNPPRKEAPPSEYFFDERKWRALVRFDEEIGAAARRAREFGAKWEDELARSYLRLNDKSYLDALIDKIVKEAQAQAQSA